MKVRIRALGALTATLAAVPFAVALGSTAADAAVNPPAATVVTSLGAVGGTSAWNIGGDQTGSPTDAISPVSDPTYVDGSLHQATPADGDKAQVVHSLLSNASDPTTGATLASISSLAYSTMDATTATNPALPALQLSMTGCPSLNSAGTAPDPNGFTTLVYEPVYNTASLPAAGTWHSWDAIDSGNAKWWSTRTITGLTGGTQASPATWNQIVAACPNGKAYQLPVNLGSGAAGSDAYVDRVSYNGTTWDFAVTGSADFTTTTPRLVTVGTAPVQFSGTVTNPATGPDYPNVRYDFSLSGITGLKANQITLEYYDGTAWQPIPLANGTGATADTITGSFGPSTGFPLPHSTTFTTQFRVAIAAGAPTGTLTVDNQLNAVDATSGAIVKTIAEHSSTLGVADEYQPVTPTRLVDTRVSGNALNNGPLLAGSVYTLDLSQTGAQLDAAAYVFNVTAVHPSGKGNLRVGPACGGGTPGTSIVNYQPGKDVANDLVIANPVVSGKPCNQFNVYSDGSNANVIIDLQGFYSASTGFTSSQSPTRAADTRTGQGGTTGPIAGGTSAAFTIGGSFGVPADAKAVAINVTAVGPTGNGNMRVYPDGADLPTTSNINYVKGVDKAAFDIVKLGTDGKIDVYSDGSAANVVIDVFGFIPAGSQTVTQTPVRVLDTRQAGGGGPIVDGSPISVPITANANSGVPAGATAVIVSLTAVRVPGGAGVGNLRAWGSGDMPTVSNINYIGPDTDVANMAIVPLAADGSIMLATQGSSMNALVDVLGYVPASTPPTS